ncbi:Hypothetical predicted protein [Marmota monax]|uniref:SMP-30/Gluconolactonase/LRE-like region domain-containing protein n=1 Tax=Marmota monax TaxID=9995 RepID=A0A5E4DCZ5_MARMO|nr:Hypothetical predicted protein [Marmota monax]
MASPRIQAVIRERHRMRECPVWEEVTAQLVYVDINARTVCWWNPLSGEVQTVGLRDPVGCVALHREGSYMVASGTCLGLLDWATGQVEWAAWLDRDKPHNRFNDGKVDPARRFVAAGPAGHPNGLDWSLDHRTLYHVDCLDYSVRAYDYDVQTGGLANSRLVCQLEPEQGMPDGLCVDTTGTLWVACIDGGRVIRMDPETAPGLQVALLTPAVHEAGQSWGSSAAGARENQQAQGPTGEWARSGHLGSCSRRVAELQGHNNFTHRDMAVHPGDASVQGDVLLLLGQGGPDYSNWA